MLELYTILFFFCCSFSLWPDAVRQRVRATYMYFGSSLALTAGSAYACAQSPTLIRLVSGGGWMVMTFQFFFQTKLHLLIMFYCLVSDWNACCHVGNRYAVSGNSLPARFRTEAVSLDVTRQRKLFLISRCVKVSSPASKQV